MSYTVLAVKWRPKRFAELVGQPHVVQALVNSLEHERLHHAYLFSGTRGVGKTTVARLLAKALNCTNGVVSEPCGECDACTAIDAGRFVDLIEVDAASRTRVDDTRELLDNVQYTPTHGRFKVYLIDEVHMLSNHSFNALLKTLEEPPPHVKFLLATTDPQKLPVTVLSRCLQFHLKKLTLRQILEQLEKICAAESVEAETDALKAIARAAEGSMRDALSLLDQAIAFGGGRIEAEQTHAMLGTIDRNHIARILDALADDNGAMLIEEVAALDERAADFAAALDELLSALQQIAVVQIVKGQSLDDEMAMFQPYAEKLTREDVQLYYQIALNGRRDLAYSRDARMGFEMTLLRMLAFRPDGGPRAAAEPAGGSARPQPSRAGSQSARARGAQASQDANRAHLKNAASERSVNGPAGSNGQAASSGQATANGQAAAGAQASVNGQSDPVNQPSADLHVVSSDVAPVEPGALGNWGEVVAATQLRGVARQLADNCEVSRATSTRIELIVSEDKSHLLTDQVCSRLQTEISRHLDREMSVSIKPGRPPRPTPADIRLANETERMRTARESVEQDANIQAMQSAFDAVVEADSIRPIDE